MSNLQCLPTIDFKLFFFYNLQDTLDMNMKDVRICSIRYFLYISQTLNTNKIKNLYSVILYS